MHRFWPESAAKRQWPPAGKRSHPAKHPSNPPVGQQDSKSTLHPCCQAAKRPGSQAIIWCDFPRKDSQSCSGAPAQPLPSNCPWISTLQIFDECTDSGQESAARRQRQPARKQSHPAERPSNLPVGQQENTSTLHQCCQAAKRPGSQAIRLPGGQTAKQQRSQFAK